MDDEAMRDYAIRYCMGRKSYAYLDGFDMAEAYWSELSQATRDDVLTASRVHGFPTNDLDRWPTIAAIRYPSVTAHDGEQ